MSPLKRSYDKPGITQQTKDSLFSRSSDTCQNSKAGAKWQVSEKQTGEFKGKMYMKQRGRFLRNNKLVVVVVVVCMCVCVYVCECVAGKGYGNNLTLVPLMISVPKQKKHNWPTSTINKYIFFWGNTLERGGKGRSEKTNTKTMRVCISCSTVGGDTVPLTRLLNNFFIFLLSYAFPPHNRVLLWLQIFPSFSACIQG